MKTTLAVLSAFVAGALLGALSHRFDVVPMVSKDGAVLVRYDRWTGRTCIDGMGRLLNNMSGYWDPMSERRTSETADTVSAVAETNHSDIFDTLQLEPVDKTNRPDVRTTRSEQPKQKE